MNARRILLYASVLSICMGAFYATNTKSYNIIPVVAEDETTTDDTTNNNTCGENATYSFDETTGTLTISGYGDMKNYEYDRDYFEEYDERISYTTAPWSDYVFDIKKIIIEDGITSIGECAFTGCISLVDVSIPNSLESMADCCFYDCKSLASITIPDSVESIGGYCFYDCKSLASITIPDSVKSIGYFCFNGCDSLTDVEMPETLNCDISIMFNGTPYYNNAKEVDGDFVIFKGVLCEYTGEYYDGLTITVPYGVTGIGRCAFTGEAVTEDMTISVILPDTVTDIYAHSFSSFKSLRSINIPDSVTNIGECAFYGCTSLMNITMPQNHISISLDDLRGTAIYDELVYNSDDVFIIIDGILMAYMGSSQDVVIPDGVRGIADDAIYSLHNRVLRTIEIPDSVTYIGSYALCNNFFTTITISNNIKYIGRRALYQVVSNAYSNEVYFIGSEEEWNALSEYELIDENALLYFCTDSITLNFDANGGKCTTSSKTLKIFDEYGKLPTPTRDGYDFLGWYTEPDGGEEVLSSDVMLFSFGIKSQTVYAHWQQWDTKTDLPDVSVPFTDTFVGKMKRNYIFNMKYDIGESTYSEPVQNYIMENDDGTLTRVECLQDVGILVETFSSSYKIIDTKILSTELDNFGGFYSGEEYNFFVFTQDNPDKNSDLELYRVVKYSKDWQRIGELSLTSSYILDGQPFTVGWSSVYEINSPMNYSNLTINELNGKLYIPLYELMEITKGIVQC